MKLSKDRVTLMARAIVKGLLNRQCITSDTPESQLVEKVIGVISEELMKEARLDAEVRELLKAHVSEIQKGDADYHKMFLMVKRKLAKERGIIL